MSGSRYVQDKFIADPSKLALLADFVKRREDNMSRCLNEDLAQPVGRKLILYFMESKLKAASIQEPLKGGSKGIDPQAHLRYVLGHI